MSGPQGWRYSRHCNTRTNQAPKKKKTRSRSWLGSVDSVASFFPSMLCDAAQATRFSNAAKVMLRGGWRRSSGPASRGAGGCQLFVTPGQQGGSKCPPAGGPYRRVASGRQAMLTIKFRKNRIIRNPARPKPICTTSRNSGHAPRCGWPERMLLEAIGDRVVGQEDLGDDACPCTLAPCRPR